MVDEITVEERIRRCLLLEKMEANKAFTKELGLEDKSLYKKTMRPGTLGLSDFPNIKDGID